MLAHAEDLSVNAGSKRKIRIFMDGAFDMMHYGHMNAFRLGRSLGTELIVGVNSDETITQCKGAPLMKDAERLMMVRGCKFVDKVVEGCPYVMNEEYLNHVISKYNIGTWLSVFSLLSALISSFSLSSPISLYN